MSPRPPPRRISIHAPLTGSDRGRVVCSCDSLYFNPRSPYGERLTQLAHSLLSLSFQSTLPLRGATRVDRYKYRHYLISIHAPLTGSDFRSLSVMPPSENFNPRSPYGERPCPSDVPVMSLTISIHAPLTGSDRPPALINLIIRISIHAPLTGSDDFRTLRVYYRSHFNPRSPYGERRP